MASIWTQGPGSPPQKLEGHLLAQPTLVRGKLLEWAGKLAHHNKAKVVKSEEFEVFLRWPDGVMFSVWAEFLSPPSAAEPGQPKRKEKSK